VIDAFKSILARDRKKYGDLWAEYGKAIKGGIFMDYKNAEKLQDLLLFETSASPDARTTLEEYVGRMSEDQKAIYYVTGESRSAVERLPQMEVFKARNIEVLYFLDKVDEFLTQHMREYAGKKLQSISRGDLDIEAEKKDEGQAEEKKDDQFEELLAFMRKILSDKVKDVRISKRLISSPVCLVSGDSGYTLNMERLMREANQPIFKATRILEVNPEHQVIRTMQRLVKSGENESKLSSYCQLLYDQALLIDNDKIEDPIRFASIISELFVDAHG
jgi:molecular chaperone HtpG